MVKKRARPVILGASYEVSDVPKDAKKVLWRSAEQRAKRENYDRQAASPDYLETAIAGGLSDDTALDDFNGLPKPIEGVSCVPWNRLAEKFCDEIQRRHHDKLSMQEVRDLGYAMYEIVLGD